MELWWEGERWFWSPEDLSLNSVFQALFLHLLHENTNLKNNAGFYLFPLWSENYPRWGGGGCFSGIIVSAEQHHVPLGEKKYATHIFSPIFFLGIIHIKNTEHGTGWVFTECHIWNKRHHSRTIVKGLGSCNRYEKR